MIGLKLDVGCGSSPTGDVNCDLYVEDIFDHRKLGHNVLRVHEISNFVCCDALHLPFVNGVFDEVFCGQLIEHIPNPICLFRELVRVCRCFGKVVVETIHRLGDAVHFNPWNKRWFNVCHVSNFNFRWLKRAAVVCGCVVVRTYVISWKCIPHDYVPLVRFPYGIGVEVTKEC